MITKDSQPEVEVERGHDYQDGEDELGSEVDQHHRHHSQAGNDQEVDTQPEDYQLQAGSMK